jgi:predicted ribosome quality control (RQC) complex YloA/Tae2 family protein
VMPDLPGTEEDRNRLKKIHETVRTVASELLSRGIPPTIARIARVVEGDRLTLLAALEAWAKNLSGADKLAMAGNRRRPNEHLVREATRPKAEAAKQQRTALLKEALAMEDEVPTGSVSELQGELSRQEATLEKLRQRRQSIEASLEATNTQIRAAELRARLIAESLQNGGKLMDQAGLQAARKSE